MHGAMRSLMHGESARGRLVRCISPFPNSRKCPRREHTKRGESPRSCLAMPEGLVWVQPEEQEQITRMRAALQDELAAALPELRHDHQFLRFLRGHGGFEKAVSRPASMLL